MRIDKEEPAVDATIAAASGTEASAHLRVETTGEQALERSERLLPHRESTQSLALLRLHAVVVPDELGSNEGAREPCVAASAGSEVDRYSSAVAVLDVDGVNCHRRDSYGAEGAQRSARSGGPGCARRDLDPRSLK